MMQSGKLGFRILTDLPRAAPDLVRQFEGIATSNLADAMGRFNFMDAGMRSTSGKASCGESRNRRAL